MAISVRVLAFARLRDLVGFAESTLEVAPDATLDDVWATLARDHPGIVPFRASTRFARNGVVTAGDVLLAGGDEIALLPPVGGG